MFLGILLGNWNEARKDTKQAEVAVKLIVNELKENLTTVDNSIKYHQQLKPAVIEFISKNKGEDFDKPFAR